LRDQGPAEGKNEEPCIARGVDDLVGGTPLVYLRATKWIQNGA